MGEGLGVHIAQFALEFAKIRAVIPVRAIKVAGSRIAAGILFAAIGEGVRVSTAATLVTYCRTVLQRIARFIVGPSSPFMAIHGCATLRAVCAIEVALFENFHLHERHFAISLVTDHMTVTR
jgi:hypothetical protein